MTFLIPVRSAICAGFFVPAQPATVNTTQTVIAGRGIAAYEIFGRSMVPHIFPTDCIIADTEGRAEPGDIVVVRLNDGRASVKRLVGDRYPWLVVRGHCPATEFRVTFSSVGAVEPVLERRGEFNELYINKERDRELREALRRLFARGGAGWFERRWNYRPGTIAKIIGGYATSTNAIRRQIEETFGVKIQPKGEA